MSVNRLIGKSERFIFSFDWKLKKQIKKNRSINNRKLNTFILDGNHLKWNFTSVLWWTITISNQLVLLSIQHAHISTDSIPNARKTIHRGKQKRNSKQIRWNAFSIWIKSVCFYCCCFISYHNHILFIS